MAQILALERMTSLLYDLSHVRRFESLEINNTLAQQYVRPELSLETKTRSTFYFFMYRGDGDSGILPDVDTNPSDFSPQWTVALLIITSECTLNPICDSHSKSAKNPRGSCWSIVMLIKASAWNWFQLKDLNIIIHPMRPEWKEEKRRMNREW
jgi:hypothetical protein